MPFALSLGPGSHRSTTWALPRFRSRISAPPITSPFDEIGLPAFKIIRDYMEGGPGKEAAHTNMDVFDDVLEDDLKQSAAVAASFLYHLAMRDALLPRKSHVSTHPPLPD